MVSTVLRFIREEEGQDLIEYALLAAFISVATIASMQFLASSIANRYNQVGSSVGSGS
jgi:pilus assembly protein Flp/PilA